MQIKCIIRFFKSFGSICWRLALTTPSLSRINTFMLCWVWSCVAVVIFVFFFCFHFLNNFPFILSFSFWVKDQKLDGWVLDQMLLCVKIASFTLINDELGLTALFHRCHNHNAQGHFVVHTSSFDKAASDKVLCWGKENGLGVSGWYLSVLAHPFALSNILMRVKL